MMGGGDSSLNPLLLKLTSGLTVLVGFLLGENGEAGETGEAGKTGEAGLTGVEVGCVGVCPGLTGGGGTL